MLFNMVLQKRYHIPEDRDGPGITNYGGIDAATETQFYLGHHHSRPPKFVIQFLTPLGFSDSLQVLKYVANRERVKEGKPLEVRGDLDSRYLLLPLDYQPVDVIRDLGEEPQYMALILPNRRCAWDNRKMAEFTTHEGAIVTVRGTGEKLPDYLYDVMQQFGISSSQNVMTSIFAQFEDRLTSGAR